MHLWDFLHFIKFIMKILNKPKRVHKAVQWTPKYSALRLNNRQNLAIFASCLWNNFLWLPFLQSHLIQGHSTTHTLVFSHTKPLTVPSMLSSASGPLHMLSPLTQWFPTLVHGCPQDPPADQPKQKLLAQATLPSIYLWPISPQSSVLPSSNYASLHKAFPDVPSQAKGALSCTPTAPCSYTRHNSALVELSNRLSPSRVSALALSCISLGRCSRQLVIS